MSLLNESSFLVETGVGLSDATSFVSIAESNNYINNTAKDSRWIDLQDSDKQKYLNVAVLYLDNVYCFIGSPLKLNQALSFPRVYNGQVFFNNNIKYAQIEIALLISDGLLFEKITSDSSAIIDDINKYITEETVGPLTTKYAQSKKSTTDTTVNYIRENRKINKLKYINYLLRNYIQRVEVRRR